MNKLLVVVVALMVLELCVAQKPDMAKIKEMMDKSPDCLPALKKLVIS